LKREWQIAVERGDAATLDVLLEQRDHLDSRDRYGQTALMLAAINDHAEIVRLLIAAGADTDREGSGAPGFAGKTARDLAKDLGRKTIADLLNSEDV